MTDRCLRDQELESLHLWPAEDPRLAHARDCPRCRGRLLQFRSFIDEADVRPGGANPEDAERTVMARLRSEISGTGAAPRGQTAHRVFREAPTHDRHAWLKWMVMRPALAAAALVVVVGGAAALFFTRPVVPPEIRLRSGTASSGDVVQVEPAMVIDDGRWQLRWRSVPGADAYLTRLLNPAFEPVEELEASADTGRVVVRPPAIRSGEVLFWQVIALRGGDPIATSAPEPLPAR